MIRLFYLPAYKQLKQEGPVADIVPENLVWMDLHAPAEEEIKSLEEKFDISFPTRQEQEEIETSSRYTEDEGTIYINSTFLVVNPGTREIEENEITFILTDKYLFSLRYFDSRVLAETTKKIKLNPEIYNRPENVLTGIIETRIDFDADLIESISKNIAQINRKMNAGKAVDEKLILEISEYQEQVMTLREVLFDKQRLATSLMRNHRIAETNGEKLRVIIKDINSLIEHVNFNFTRLEYMQNNFMGLINIEQNKIIKIFTVVSVIFMPPTLIASIYGMNFKTMPELDWLLGYPSALVLMLASSAVTLYLFKRKKWL